MGECLALLFLAWFSAKDIREKRLPLTGLLGSFFAGIIYMAACGIIHDGNWVYRLFPGLFLILLARLSGEQVGYGDGMAVLVLGCLLGAARCAVVCGIAFMISGFFVTGKLCMKKAAEPVPFLPFLLAALEVVLLVE